MPMYVQDGSDANSNNMLSGQNDPVDRVSLIYENQNRLQEVSSSYCSLVQAITTLCVDLQTHQDIICTHTLLILSH